MELELCGAYAVGGSTQKRNTMDQTGRILYINYDSLEPAGGVKVIYSHVWHLVRHGYPAFVVHNKAGFRPPWLRCEVPRLYFEKDLRILSNDKVVIPEDHNAALEAFRKVSVSKYVFCQNHFYIFKGLKDYSWDSFGISDVFCCSGIISEFVRSVFGYREVPVIHNAIPLDVFRPAKKKLQIAYMPRKRPFELDFIRNLFTRLDGQYKHVPWVCIDKMDEAKVAEILGESAIFLSTSLYEGFGLPPLEAMSCGCIVVGFHG
jgi:glycosyltransferase involved in cell wall biosynthesis